MQKARLYTYIDHKTAIAILYWAHCTYTCSTGGTKQKVYVMRYKLPLNYRYMNLERP